MLNHHHLKGAFQMKLDEDEILAAKKRAKEMVGKDPSNAAFLAKAEFLLTNLDEILKPYEQKAGIKPEMYADAAKVLNEAFKEADGDKVLEGFAKIGQMLRKILSFKADENGNTTPDTNFLDELGISDEAFAEMLAKFLVMYKSQSETDITSFKSAVAPQIDKYLKLHPPPAIEDSDENEQNNN